MSRTPGHPAAAWIANLLLPGAGLVLSGSVGAGAALAVAWGVAAAAAVVAMVVAPPEVASPWLWAFPAAGYVFAQGALAVRRRIRPAPEGADEALRRAVALYLQDRLDEAAETCRAVLKRDPRDVELTLRLASIRRRQGRAAEARRLFERARYMDDEGRWDFEIARELGPPRNVAPPKA